MEPIAKSGYYYSNKIARIALITLEEVAGKNGLKVILKTAGLPGLIDNLPPDNLNLEFDFADFSALNGALEEMYGLRGGRVLALRAGRACFREFFHNFGDAEAASRLLAAEIPLVDKMREGMPAMMKIFNETSDQHISIEETDDHFTCLIQHCPVCYGRHTDKPACSMAVGLIQGSLNWISSGKEFNVVQTSAKSVGDESCDFVIPKEPNS